MSIRKLHLPPVIIVTIVKTTQNKLKKKKKKKNSHLFVIRPNLYCQLVRVHSVNRKNEINNGKSM